MSAAVTVTCRQWVFINPITGRRHLFNTKEEATEAAIRENKLDPDRPSFRLYELTQLSDGRTAKIYHGRLWREFGRGFRPETCWNTELPGGFDG